MECLSFKDLQVAFRQFNVIVANGEIEDSMKLSLFLRDTWLMGVENPAHLLFPFASLPKEGNFQAEKRGCCKIMALVFFSSP